MKKKLISLALVCAMVFALGATALARDGGTQVDQDSTDKTGTMNVTYTVDPTYTVTIPASVTLGGTSTIGVSNVNIGSGQKILVKLTAAANTVSDTNFTVKTTDNATATYQIKKGETALKLNDTAYEFSYDGTVHDGSGVLSFTVPTDAVYAGTYTDQLTFTISVE